MSEYEVGACEESDNYGLQGPTTGPSEMYRQSLIACRFEIGPGMVKSLIAKHEGHYYGTAEFSFVLRLRLWDFSASVWSATLAFHSMPYDYVMQVELVGDDCTPYVSDGIVWVGTTVYPADERLEAGIWTDWISLDVDLKPARVVTAHNLFGQHFRAFDDGAAGDVSFERRDRPAGDFSTPIHPFGEGSNSPSIQCLPDGRLHAAYIDADGNLVKAQSRDDGETWEVV
jgi:hypothetical protein